MRFDVAGAMRRVGRIGLDLLLPPGCMACAAPVTEAFALCGRCFANCHFITEPFCGKCGVMFSRATQGAGGLCPSCIAHRPVFGQARAALTYDRHARPLLLQFKHAERTELARLFAPMMARAGAAMLTRAEVLVPVPLHRSRLRLRGYNQSALLARAVGRICGVPAVLDALERTRRTPSLGTHDAAGRARLLAGAVAVNGQRVGAVQGRRIVLVDDVMTSGATANSCAGALLAAGAARVDVLVVARVPDPMLSGADEDATG